MNLREEALVARTFTMCGALNWGLFGFWVTVFSHNSGAVLAHPEAALAVCLKGAAAAAVLGAPIGFILYLVYTVLLSLNPILQPFMHPKLGITDWIELTVVTIAITIGLIAGAASAIWLIPLLASTGTQDPLLASIPLRAVIGGAGGLGAGGWTVRRSVIKLTSLANRGRL